MYSNTKHVSDIKVVNSPSTPTHERLPCVYAHQKITFYKRGWTLAHHGYPSYSYSSHGAGVALEHVLVPAWAWAGVAAHVVR